jgi:hypothetical protein
MKLRYFMLCGLLAGGLAFAQDAGERANLTGTWESQDGGGSSAKAVWILEEKGDAVHISKSQGDQKLAEYSCGAGKDCDVKDAGQKVKVSLYFNGAKLVELETRGTDVIKRTFASPGQGDALEVEVIQLVPAGKTETLHFRRVATAVAQK